MSTKIRLKEYIAFHAKSIKDFELQCGLSNGYVNNMKQGIGHSARKRIKEKCPDLSMTWLITGEGPMIKEGNNVKDSSNTSPLIYPAMDEKLLAMIDEKDRQLARKDEQLAAKDSQLSAKDEQIIHLLKLLDNEKEAHKKGGHMAATESRLIQIKDKKRDRLPEDGK